MKRILIVEDEAALLNGLRDNLEYEGYEVISASNGETGLLAMREKRPDLALLDIILPKMNGFEVCRRARREGIRVPILMLTARGEEGDRVRGFDCGADDYLTKPFSVLELLGRIKAILRRTENGPAQNPPERITIGGVDIDFKRFEARKNGVRLEMSRKEFGILRHLAGRPNEVVGRDELLNRVWGYDRYPTTRTVDNHIALLRAKIEPDPAHPRYLLTFRGVGYKLALED
ncbi:MAG: response regulator transcription factor [Candidatus Aminicenantes bacterium]|nr:response regulator transcription factor [Candidatus Aminicenantes bacterium]